VYTGVSRAAKKYRRHMKNSRPDTPLVYVYKSSMSNLVINYGRHLLEWSDIYKSIVHAIAREFGGHLTTRSEPPTCSVKYEEIDPGLPQGAPYPSKFLHIAVVFACVLQYPIESLSVTW
jgi:hypothetical protein